MKKIKILKLSLIIGLVATILFLVGCASKDEGKEVITEAKVIEIDSKNNSIMVNGINTSSTNQIGDKCVISCEGIKLFGEAGEDIDLHDFKVGDVVSIMSDGLVQESYPTRLVNVEWIQINNED